MAIVNKLREMAGVYAQQRARPQTWEFTAQFSSTQMAHGPGKT